MSKEEQKSENSQENKDLEEDLDITSAQFNPLKALYSKDVKLPVQNVRKLDNLGMFMSRLKNAGNKFEAEVKFEIS